MWPKGVWIAEQLCEYTSGARINLQDTIGLREPSLKRFSGPKVKR
jgi:hypothetical protein